MQFSNNFVFPFLFTKLLSEISEKNFLPLNSSYTCILRVFYVSIDTSFTNFCGQKNVVLTLNLCNFTLRLALRIYKKNFKHKSNKWNSGFSRVFYVSIDTSFTNFFRQKNVVPTLNLCNFTVRLTLRIYKKNFKHKSNKWNSGFSRVFYVSIDTSFTNFCGQKNVVLTLNLCNFTVRLALRIYKKNFKHKSNKWNSGFSRVFYVSIDTSFTNFFGQKNVVPTLNLCNFTVRLALGIYKNIFEQIAVNETRVFLVFFTFQLTPVSRTFLDRKTLFQH